MLRPLVDDEEELEALVELEGATSGRLRAEAAGLPNMDPRELTYRAWGGSMVNAAFSYVRHEGNRFNAPGRGAWYCAFREMTAVAEVGFHRTRELRRIDRFHDEAVYQVLLADFIGRFHDLRSRSADDPRPACLDPDPAVGYPAGQALAARLRSLAEPSRGLIYPSLRQSGGECLVAFEPRVVQDVRLGARWRLRWSGSPSFQVEQA